MQRLYKRGDSSTWWCAYKDARGRWVRRSTGKRDRRAAEIVAAQYERASTNSTNEAKDPIPLKQALERVVADRAARGRAAGTLSMYASKAGHFVRIWGEGLALDDVDAVRVDAYIETRLAEGAARSTIGKELTTLRVALKLAKRRGEFHADVDGVMPERWTVDYKPKTTHLTAWEFLWLLPELRDDRAAHVAFIVATAADWSCSLRARREDIDLRAGHVYVRGTKTDARERTLPIVAFMRPLLERVAVWHGDEYGPMFRAWGNVRRDLAEACERAGVTVVTPRDLRRTCATWLRCAGVEPHLIAEMLGHVDARMVERVYGQLSPDALGRLMRERLDEPRRERRAQNSGYLESITERDERGSSGEMVPRVGIEPTTRGFSVLYDLAEILDGKRIVRSGT